MGDGKWQYYCYCCCFILLFCGYSCGSILGIHCFRKLVCCYTRVIFDLLYFKTTKMGTCLRSCISLYCISKIVYSDFNPYAYSKSNINCVSSIYIVGYNHYISVKLCGLSFWSDFKQTSKSLERHFVEQSTVDNLI